MILWLVLVAFAFGLCVGPYVWREWLDDASDVDVPEWVNRG